MSVTVFALITGVFVFEHKSMLWRNVSRLLFVIFTLSIISPIVYEIADYDGGWIDGLKVGLIGGRDSWYLYSILPVYALAPLLRKWVNVKRSVICFISFYASAVGLWFISFYDLVPIMSGFLEVLSWSLILVAMAFMGYLMNKYVNSKQDFKIKFSIAIMMFAIGLTGVILGQIGRHNGHMGYFYKAHHCQIFLTMLAISVVGFGLLFPFYSKHINWLARNSYYVYEFHYLWQIIWITFLSINNEHLDMYIAWISISLFGISFSIGLTYFQRYVWDRYITRPLQVKIDKNKWLSKWQ